MRNAKRHKKGQKETDRGGAFISVEREALVVEGQQEGVSGVTESGV